MSDWFDSFQDALKQREVTPTDFARVTARLLDHGIIWWSDSNVEKELYDIACRVETHLEDYLGLTGVRLFHDKTYGYFRAYPPGAQVPGLPDVETPVTGLRRTLTRAEVKLALILRLLYQQKVGEGNIDDDAEAAVSLEEINSAMVSVFEEGMPQRLTEYTQALKAMRKFRILRFDSDIDLLEGDAWMYIRPSIITTVSEDVLAGVAKAHLPEEEEETEPAEDADDAD